MSGTTWIIVSIVALLVLLGFISWFMIKHRKRNCPPDYYAFFLIGLVWVPIGFSLDNYFMSALGFVLMIVGLMHRDAWKKSRHCWEKVDSKSKRLLAGMLALLSAFVFFGFTVLYLMIQGYI